MKKKLRTVELFSGTKSFSKVMQAAGHRTFTIDNAKELEPDMRTNILDLSDDSFAPDGTLGQGGRVDILWASPPCTAFSVASIGHHWGGGRRSYKPITAEAKLGMRLAKKTLKIIESSRPRWWFIENPQGVLKNLPFMQGVGVMHTIWYCHYGDTRAKPTNIWTNAMWWKPQPPCHNRRGGHRSDCCCTDHEAAPRGAKTGTQGIDGARDRGRIPAALFEEILAQIPR